MKVGDTVYVLDRYGRGGWKTLPVTGETRISWVIGEPWRSFKIRKKKYPQNYPNILESEDAVKEANWVGKNSYRIGHEVGRLRNPATLRAIASMIGYKEETTEK